MSVGRGRTYHRRAQSALSALLLAAGGLAAAPAWSEPAARAYNIPSGSLADALNNFAEASHLSLVYSSAVTRGLRSKRLNGSYSPREALERLLAGSGLSYRMADDAVTIERSSAVTAQAGAIPLDTINVQGDGQSPRGPGVGYVATRSVSATKSDTPIIETPQTISVVTRQQMDDQNAQSVPEALRYTSGVMSEQRGVNSQGLEYVYNRGFQIDEYLNGLILPGSLAGYNITSIDAYMLNRVELVQGPASVLYGQASPGGLLDLVSKAPTDTPYHEIVLQGGNYDRVQGSVDVSDKLNADGTLLGRITADAFDTNTQTQYIQQQRIAIAPSVTWRPDANTNLTVFANLQYDPEAGYYNNVVAQGTVLPGVVKIPRSLDPGDPSYDHFSKTEASIGYSFEHDFNSTWSVYQNFRYLYDNETIAYVGVDGLSADGKSLTRSAYYNHGVVNALALDNRAQAKFSTGPLNHTFIFGVDYYRTDYNHIFQLGDAPNLSIANPVYNQTIAAPNFTLGTSGDQLVQQVGLYAQDQVRLGQWAFMTGVREDFAQTYFKSMTSGAVTNENDAAFTWRTGLVYLFHNGLAPYASYSTSFQPDVGTTASGAAFKPTTGQQYEAGIKYQPPGSNSFVTASAFHILEQNVATADPDNPNFQVQTGEVRSQGVTLEGHYEATSDLKLIGAYTYTDLKNTQSNQYLGKVPVGIPENMASAWVDYRFPWSWTRAVDAGVGVRYLGSSWGDAANDFQVPAVTLFDAAVHLDLGRLSPRLKGATFTVSASNIFDKVYISSCLSSTFCTFGDGRTVLANLKYTW